MQADKDQINRMLAGSDPTHAEVIQVRIEILWFVYPFSHVATVQASLMHDAGLILSLACRTFWRVHMQRRCRFRLYSS